LQKRPIILRSLLLVDPICDVPELYRVSKKTCVYPHRSAKGTDIDQKRRVNEMCSHSPSDVSQAHHMSKEMYVSQRDASKPKRRMKAKETRESKRDVF